MAEYIGVDTLWREVECTAFYDKRDKEAMEDMILSCPKVINASPIVRCRECVHLGHVHDFMGLEIESFQCGRTNTEVKLDDFCSYGEREDE